MKEIRKDFYALKPICKYIECQLNTFRKECNFTDEELEVLGNQGLACGCVTGKCLA